MVPTRRAKVDDVHRCATAMPFTTRAEGPRTVYQVGGKSFVFFRGPRPDAFDPATGERYDDVIVLWVESEEAKTELLADPTLPLFTTPHFDGHPSVLLRGCRVGELGVDEVEELVADAWLARASATRGRKWLEARGIPPGIR